MLDSFQSGYRPTEGQNPKAVGRNNRNSEKTYDQGKGNAYYSSASSLTDRRFLLEDSRTTVCGSCSHFARECRRICVSAKQVWVTAEFESTLLLSHEDDLR
jgi:hypothetical protein